MRPNYRIIAYELLRSNPSMLDLVSALEEAYTLGLEQGWIFEYEQFLKENNNSEQESSDESKKSTAQAYFGEWDVL